jgi:hypothetical protein
MKPAHIIGISAGAVVGALLIGGTGFALGADIKDQAEAREMFQSMVQERQGEQGNFADGPRGERFDGPGRGFPGGPGRGGDHGHGELGLHDELGDGDMMQNQFGQDDQVTEDLTDTGSDVVPDTTDVETSPLQ